MSLDWNTKECPGNGVTSGWIEQEDVDPERPDSFLHADTNSLVWGAFCGFYVGQFTPKSIDEIIWRIEFLKKIDRPWLSDRSFPTPEAVANHLDLHTNCDTKTRKQWLAFVTACLSDEVTRSIARSYDAV